MSDTDYHLDDKFIGKANIQHIGIAHYGSWRWRNHLEGSLVFKFFSISKSYCKLPVGTVEQQVAITFDFKIRVQYYTRW